ncbi:MAG: hypothetical protein ACI4TM_05255 [Candidatus Cryptobacteroides sp.]
MKTTQNKLLTIILMTIVQMVICNFFDFSLYVVLSLLPAMIMCYPLSRGTMETMVVAFLSGLAVDWLSDGLIGLNALALVPVALCRKPVTSLIMGEEAIVREEDFTIRKNGFLKVSAVLVAGEVIFFAIYILADGALTRPFWFDLTRFLASVVASYFLSLAVVEVMSPSRQ